MLGCISILDVQYWLTRDENWSGREWGQRQKDNICSDTVVVFVYFRYQFLRLTSHDSGENGRKNKNTVFRSERNNNGLAAIKTPSHHGITYSTE